MASTERLVATLGGDDGGEGVVRTLPTEADLEAIADTPMRQLALLASTALALAVDAGRVATVRVRTEKIFEKVSEAERKKLFLSVARSLLNESPCNLPKIQPEVMWKRAQAMFEFLSGLFCTIFQSKGSAIDVLWDIIADNDLGPCRVRSSRGSATHATWYDLLLRMALERTTVLGRKDTASKVFEEHRMLAHEARIQIGKMKAFGLIAPCQLSAAWALIGEDARLVCPCREEDVMEGLEEIADDAVVAEILERFDFEDVPDAENGGGCDAPKEEDDAQSRITDHYPASRTGKQKTKKSPKVANFKSSYTEVGRRFRFPVVKQDETFTSNIMRPEEIVKKRKSAARARKSSKGMHMVLHSYKFISNLKPQNEDLECKEVCDDICVDWI